MGLNRLSAGLVSVSTPSASDSATTTANPLSKYALKPKTDVPIPRFTPSELVYSSLTATSPDLKLENIRIFGASLKEKLRGCHYQPITISGNPDHRCWVRAPWFAIFHQYRSENSLPQLFHLMIKILNNTQCKKTKRWLQDNQHIVSAALAQLADARYRFNYTLNAEGHFSAAVEALIENVSRAIFHDNIFEATDNTQDKSFNAYESLEHCEFGSEYFSGLLLRKMHVNAMVASDSFQKSSAGTGIIGEWVGSEAITPKQTGCILLHWSKADGHFDVALLDKTFAAADHNHMPENKANKKSSKLNRLLVETQSRFNCGAKARLRREFLSQGMMAARSAQ